MSGDEGFSCIFFQAIQILGAGGNSFIATFEQPQVHLYTGLNLKVRSECMYPSLTVQESKMSIFSFCSMNTEKGAVLQSSKVGLFFSCIGRIKVMSRSDNITLNKHVYVFAYVCQIKAIRSPSGLLVIISQILGSYLI